METANYDKYGGYKPINFGGGMGYFSLGKKNDKHFLVTPEGNGFRSIGINHFHMLPWSGVDYDKVITHVRSLGFNSGDYQGPQWMWNRIPYIMGLELVPTSSFFWQNKFSYKDVFDPNYLNELENKIRNIVRPQANNKNLICYFLTDVPIWYGQKFGMTWIQFFKSLPAQSPGGRAWRDWRSKNPNVPEDDFIPVIADQLYKEATQMIRRYDSNHLIFSDRYLEYDFYGTNPKMEKVVAASLPYVDGIAVQPKIELDLDFLDGLYEKFKKPIYIADHTTSHSTPQHKNTLGKVTEDSASYSTYYRKAVFDTITRPYIVGYNKCQYQDEFWGGVLKQGLVREDGSSYAFTNSLYKTHVDALAEAYDIVTPEPPVGDEISFVNAPTSVAPLNAYPLKVSYSASTSRKLRVVVLDGQGTRLGAKNVNVEKGQNTIDVIVELTSSPALDSSLQWKCSILPIDGDWRSTIDSELINDVEVISNHIDSISFNHVPMHGKVSKSYTVSVKYSAEGFRDIHVALFNKNWEWIGGNSISVNEGSGYKSITITMDSPIPPDSGYKFKCSIRPEGTDWRAAISKQVVDGIAFNL